MEIGVILEEFMKDRICNPNSVPDKDVLSVDVDLMETNHIETGASTSSADEVDEKTPEILESLQDNKGSSSGLAGGLISPVRGREKHRWKGKLRKRKA